MALWGSGVRIPSAPPSAESTDRMRPCFQPLTFCVLAFLGAARLTLPLAAVAASGFQISEDDARISISTDLLEAVVQKTNYVTGVGAGTFLDKQTGFREEGYGLDIVD